MSVPNRTRSLPRTARASPTACGPKDAESTKIRRMSKAHASRSPAGLPAATPLEQVAARLEVEHHRIEPPGQGAGAKMPRAVGVQDQRRVRAALQEAQPAAGG